MTNPRPRISLPALNKRLRTEADAYLMLEELVWGDTPVCPHCGSVVRHYFLNPANGSSRATRTGSVSQRRVWKCAEKECRRQFSVLTGTVMHGSKVEIKTWLCVIYEICASKNGVSAREIQRKYELTPKTAWFLLHRLREAMTTDRVLAKFSGTVIADESWVGGESRRVYGTLQGERKPPRRTPEKSIVFTLIDQASGEARSKVIPNVTAATLADAVLEHVDPSQSRLMTDDYGGYVQVGRKFRKGHATVTHGLGEYVRGDVTTNAVENYFGQLKRSIDGTFHHVSHEHLHRYLAEFDFRFSTRKMSDTDRVHRLMGQARGRRLAYRPLTGS